MAPVVFWVDKVVTESSMAWMDAFKDSLETGAVVVVSEVEFLQEYVPKNITANITMALNVFIVSIYGISFCNL
jgi:hypothetical protein